MLFSDSDYTRVADFIIKRSLTHHEFGQELFFRLAISQHELASLLDIHYYEFDSDVNLLSNILSKFINQRLSEVIPNLNPELGRVDETLALKLNESTAQAVRIAKLKQHFLREPLLVLEAGCDIERFIGDQIKCFKGSHHNGMHLTGITPKLTASYFSNVMGDDYAQINNINIDRISLHLRSLTIPHQVIVQAYHSIYKKYIEVDSVGMVALTKQLKLLGNPVYPCAGVSPTLFNPKSESDEKVWVKKKIKDTLVVLAKMQSSLPNEKSMLFRLHMKSKTLATHQDALISKLIDDLKKANVRVDLNERVLLTLINEAIRRNRIDSGVHSTALDKGVTLTKVLDDIRLCIIERKSDGSRITCR